MFDERKKRKKEERKRGKRRKKRGKRTVSLLKWTPLFLKLKNEMKISMET